MAPARQGALEFDQYSDEDFWNRAEREALVVVRAYAESRGGDGSCQATVRSERGGGFALLDLLQKLFHVVLMNPPYIESYPRTTNEVYAASWSVGWLFPVVQPEVARGDF